MSGNPTNRELTQVCDINGRHPMKRTAGTLYFITVMFLLVACDPAIAIRQIRASNGTSAPITIDVKTQHPLVGERIYVPQVTVTNGSDLPITITSVELAAKQGTYANKPRQPGSYPSTVPPCKTETLDIWFDLTDDVRETFFRQPAELRVHYKSRGRDETAHVSVIGGHLDTNAP
jgi:hypothetical protein